jgi:hypothetical protein
MKTIVSTCCISLFCLFTSSSNGQQLLNGGFEETYLDDNFKPSILKPFYWLYGSPNSLDCGIPLCSITNESNNDDWALKLETILCGGAIYAGSVFTTFDFQNSLSLPDAIAHTINDRPDQISFNYKYSPINNDTALVRALLFNYPEDVTFANPYYLSYIDTIAHLEYDIFGAANNYTQLTINFDYQSTDVPAYIMVSFFSDKKALAIPPTNYGNPGTTLWIDDVSLIYLPTSIHNLISSGDVTLFPNPVAEHFSIDLPGNTTINSVSILDFSGRVVNIQASKNGMYSLNGLSTGMYFVQIETDKGSVVKKVVKE